MFDTNFKVPTYTCTEKGSRVHIVHAHVFHMQSPLTTHTVHVIFIKTLHIHVLSSVEHKESIS